MKISVIISTYNSPEWLKKVLWGYEQQTAKCFELIVADDGSRQDTKQLLQAFKNKLSYPLKHVWHEDKGFRKCEILNKATTASSFDYLLFSDGDCVPRKDLVEVHLKHRENGYFLSSGYLKLPMSLSKAIRLEDIEKQKCFDLLWLLRKGMKVDRRNLRFIAKQFRADGLLNRVTPTKATWNGHGSSGWKKDILAVNGHDERMEYGGQDREIGERLWNLGIQSKQIRFSAICIHLDHSRGYKDASKIESNLNIRRTTVGDRIAWTEHGIVKGPPADAKARDRGMNNS